MSASRLARVVDAYHAAGVFSGTVFVARGSEVLLERAVGPADAANGRANTIETPVQIGSVTKPMVAAAILRLVDAGQLGLDDTLAQHLPDFTPDFGARISLRQILGHRAALARDHSNDTLSLTGFPGMDGVGIGRPALLDYLNKNLQALDFEPGTRREYSNSGYRLLAMVLEEKLQLDYAHCLRRLVFEPAGMNLTRTKPEQSGGPEGAYGHEARALRTEFRRSREARHMVFARGCGDVSTTAADLGRFVAALLDDRLLSVESTRLLLDARPGEPTLAFESREVLFGGRPTLELSHAGGFTGYSSYVLFLPRPGVRVAVLGNVDAAPAARIANDLLATLDGREPDLPRAYGQSLLSALARNDLDAARGMLERLPAPGAELGIMYGASQATGPPNVPPGWVESDLALSWVPRASDALEWLELGFTQPVEATRLVVIGASLHVYALEGIGPEGGVHALPWDPARHTRENGLGRYDRKLAFDRPLSRLRIHLDGSRVAGKPVVDAVALYSADGVAHWADEAQASSAIFSRSLHMLDAGLRPDALLLEDGARDLFELGREDEALALLRFASDYYPHGARGAEALARGLVKTGRHEEARGLLESVLAQAPGRDPASQLLKEIRASSN